MNITAITIAIVGLSSWALTLSAIGYGISRALLPH